MMKQTAQMQQQIADIVLQGAANAAASSRGGIVNLTA